MRSTRLGYCRDSGAPSSTISLGDADRLAEGRSEGIVRGRAATERTRLSAAGAVEDPAGAAGELCSMAEAAGGDAEEDPAAGGGGDAAEEEVSTRSQEFLQRQRQGQNNHEEREVASRSNCFDAADRKEMCGESLAARVVLEIAVATDSELRRE